MITKHDDLFRFIETNYKRARCLDCGAVTIDGEHNANHTICIEISISNQEWGKLKESFRLWENNYDCPVCGAPANPSIKANETGFNYCSDEHAREDVIAKRPEGGY